MNTVERLYKTAIRNFKSEASVKPISIIESKFPRSDRVGLKKFETKKYLIYTTDRKI